MIQVAHPPSRLRANIIALSVLQGLNYLVPLVTVPYLVRVLGPSRFGLLSFAQALVLYFDLFTDYGFNLSATRAIARARGSPDALARIFWRTLFAKTALMLASFVVLGAIVGATPRFRETWPLFAAVFLTVVGTAVLPMWFFQGLEEMKGLTIAHATARLLTIPALFLLVRAPHDYVRAAAIQGGVPVLAALLLVPLIRAKLPHGPRAMGFPNISGALRENWSVFVANTAVAVNPTTTIVVLGLVAGNTEVGYYSAADKVIRAVTALLAPVTQALYPHLNSLKSRSLELTLRLMRRSYVWIGLLALGASAATFFLARPVGLIVLGKGFDRSIAVLRWLAPVPFLFALINVIGIQTMLVFEMDDLLGRVVLVGVLINILLTAALSAGLGAVGAAVSAVATAVLIVLGLAWSLRHRAALA